jgi:DNA-binding NarL/FixJ family response regulator
MIVDDTESTRLGLRAVLGTYPEIRIVGEAENGRDAIAVALERKPNVVLMDIRMPVMNGVDACRRIKDASPDTAVVLTSMYADSAVEAVSAADAVLPKGSPSDTLMCVLREVALRPDPKEEGRVKK